MKPFIKHRGKVVSIFQPNIDTDQILPKQFLKRIEKTGYGAFLFYDWRFKPDGTPQPDFVLNSPHYKNASVLLAGENFGCGSSREHAPWALSDFGFRVIIAQSFADIFYNNCFKIGLLPVVLEEKTIKKLVARAETSESYFLTADLENLEIYDNEEFHAKFTIDEFRRRCLLEGLDDIDLTLQFEGQISEYEQHRKDWLPVIR